MLAHVDHLAAKDESSKSLMHQSNVACKPRRLWCCRESLMLGQCLILLSLRPSSQRKGRVVSHAMPRRVQQQQQGKPYLCLLLLLLLKFQSIVFQSLVLGQCLILLLLAGRHPGKKVPGLAPP
jgi:hypothetical protein